MGRSEPFVFLEEVKDDFMQHYDDSIKSNDPHPLAEDDYGDDDLFDDRISIAYNLDREFGCLYVVILKKMLDELYSLLTMHFSRPNIEFIDLMSCFVISGRGLKTTCNIV
ncbi:unnamed protein product [Fraxinus pennsylvanica]|uniref:Longin domain-containing protein n=1 Tax=Fraxinus pennsylvanica TaxID=56036 RepID=A0AAD2DUK0_9LAMI|nr:unnamed protein product [Fraxinus pennsylvanica]